MAAPDELVPWPEGAAAVVASPAATRTAGDLPLASASKRILDGECRCWSRKTLFHVLAPADGCLCLAALKTRWFLYRRCLQAFSSDLCTPPRRIVLEHRSPALLQGLGWSQPPAPLTLAAQLRALGQKHGGSDDDGSGDSSIGPDKRRALAVAVPRLLQASIPGSCLLDLRIRGWKWLCHAQQCGSVLLDAAA